MNWTGKLSVFGFALLALALIGILVPVAQAAPLSLRQDAGGYYAPFHTSFPVEGGPYITAATFRDADLTAAPGDEDEVVIVFNEPLQAPVTSADFVLDDFAATTATLDASGRMVTLSGLTGTVSPGVDSVGVAWLAVTGVDGYQSHDIGMVPIVQGPVIVQVEFDQGYNSAAVESPYVDDNHAITVTFDHDVQIVGMAATLFATTPELAGVTLDNTVAGATITCVRTGGSQVRWTHPGIAKIWLDVNRVRWADAAVNNSAAQKVVIENQGPALMAAYYNDKGTAAQDDDVVWLVYNQPVPQESLAEPELQYLIGWDPLNRFAVQAGQTRMPGGAAFSHVLQISGELLTAGGLVPDGANEWIVEDGSYLHSDYQGVTGPGRMARCNVGVGITRAAYRTETDALYLWFSQPLNEADVTELDLEIVPDIANWRDAVSITSIGESNNMGYIVLTGWSALAAWLPSGYFVKIAADDSFDGLDTPTAGCDGVSLIPICDDTKPTVLPVEVPTLTYKGYGASGDTAFLAWEEVEPVDDSDQYFLFFTKLGMDQLNDEFIHTNLNNALPVANHTPVTQDTGLPQRFAVDITAGQSTTEGLPIVDGDELNFMLVPATYWGLMNDDPASSRLVFGAIVVGPCTPRDFLAGTDDDIIHVTASFDEGTSAWTYWIAGDAEAVPCGEEVLIYDGPDWGTANLLGRGPVLENGSFAAIELDGSVVDLTEVATFFVFSDASNIGCPIRNDRVAPELLVGPAYADRFNPYQIYKAGDFVNLLVLANDRVGDPAGPTAAYSDLLEVFADMSTMDDREALPVELGSHPVDAVPLVSLGADEIDNDGDWDADDDAIDRFEPADDEMNFPEPYFDENGDGGFTPGETFVDRNLNDLFDGPGGSGNEYDLNLDSADEDEHGWYEVRLLPAGEEGRYNDAEKGFQLLDPVTDPDGMVALGEILDVPLLFALHDVYLDHTFAYTADAPPYTAELDEVAPTVSKLTELWNTITAEDILEPTNPVYVLGPHMDFEVGFPSDADVLFGVTQISLDGGETWLPFAKDPDGDMGDEGYPGLADYDDDGDGQADLLDVEIVDAMQADAAADAAGDNDGVWVTNDGRDNDNDAYFVFEPYFDPGLGATLQRIVWYNIDEAGETYDPDLDDNEDGIVDGEAVPIGPFDGVHMVLAADDAFAGTLYVSGNRRLGFFPGDAGMPDEFDLRELTELIPPAWGVLDESGILTDPFPGLPWGDPTPVADDDGDGFYELSWSGIHGGDIDLEYFLALYNQPADGVTPTTMRVLAYDQAGNVNPAYSVPFAFTVDLTATDVALTDCLLDGYPADFVDVRPDEPGMQIFNRGIYTLTTENDADAVRVAFDWRTSEDGGVIWTDWAGLDVDNSRPFAYDWDASVIAIPVLPVGSSVLAQFRAYGQDEFGNWQEADSACVIEVEVVSDQAPWTWFTLIDQTANPNNIVPPPNPGSLPYPYYYRDVIGPLRVPVGDAIDVWALFSPGEGLPATTEHDVLRVVFEYRLAGSDEPWTPFATRTGHVAEDGTVEDLTLPVAVTFDTSTLETGTYDLRVYSCDIDGNNCDEQGPTVQYDIAKIVVVTEGLRAYIQPLAPRECGEQQVDWLDLYAINWIHDYFIDEVLFQYSDDGGTTWYDIATDDGDNEGDPRGDIVLRRGAGELFELEGSARGAFTSQEMFIDYDGDGYSPRDPIILDVGSELGIFDSGDEVLIGDWSEIMAGGLFELASFAADEFRTGEFPMSYDQWIFKDNGLNPPTNELELWHAMWDVSGVENGEYLLRAVATDAMGATDEMVDYQTVSIAFGGIAPTATIATVTTPDGLVSPVVMDAYYPGSTGWLMLCPAWEGTDISYMHIQFRIPGHVVFGDWRDLDTNNYGYFYADIDGVLGFSNEDEVYFDSGAAPFVLDDGDVLVYAGMNGSADAPASTPLVPMAGYYDAAGNQVVLDDLSFHGTAYHEPYCAFFIIPPLQLNSDTPVEFRAVATDQSCNTDPNPAVARIVIGETNTPESDVVWVKLADGTEIDILAELSDGDDVDQLGTEEIAEPITLLVTAEDETAITAVELMFRPVGECVGLEEWEDPWMSMSAYVTNLEASGGVDTAYDFLFTVDLAALVDEHGYGVYEFYGQARDDEGNASPVPVNPYRFKILTNFAWITSEAAPIVPGSEFWFDADINVPDENARVEFLYAERVTDVAIDASAIYPHPARATYVTLPLEFAMVDPAASAVLTVNGVQGTYYETWQELLAEGGEFDWTYESGTIEFKVRPAPSATVLVSYDVTPYMCLWADGMPGTCSSTDFASPYTVAWDVEHGGVPAPQVAGTDAYDVIARVLIGTENECLLAEPLVSEGFILPLQDEEAARGTLWAGGLWNEDPGEFYPGNPSFDSWEGEEGTIEWKMSGVEHEFFVTSEDADVASVDLTFSGPYRDDVVVPMTEIEDGSEFVYMTFTMYESDFPDIPNGFENVWLMIDTLLGKLPAPDQYPMTEIEAGIWQVSDVPVRVGFASRYAFAIDQVGNNWEDWVADPRNLTEAIPPKMAGELTQPPEMGMSLVSVPPAPFWYASGPDFGDLTAVWQITTTVTDGAGNVGVSRRKWDGGLADFVYDPVPPTVESVHVSSTRFAPGDDVTVTATVTDPVPADFNVITVASVRVQYSPNYTTPDARWYDFGIDIDRTDGWSVTGNVPDPGSDGIDNDGDGNYDEDDEAMAVMAFRVLALDDGHNYSDPLAVTAIVEVDVDSACPAAVLTSPANGLVFPYGSSITLAATTEDVDVHHVLFQFNKGDGWEDVDITPEDSTDAPFDAVAPYEVTFLTTDYLSEEDSYIRFRAVAYDAEMNGCEDDAIEVLVIVNDITGPTAFVLEGQTTGGEYLPVTDPALALHGPAAMLRGVAVDPSGIDNVATVTVQYLPPEGGDWVTIAIDNEFTGLSEFAGEWEVQWDTHPLAEGMYQVRAVAADVDGNRDPDPAVVSIRIDNSAPTVIYDPIGSFFAGFVPFAWYDNDGTPGQSKAITPDPETGDLAFMVATPDADIESIVLQWRRAGEDPLGGWDSHESAVFDFEPGLTFQSGGVTHYVWWLRLDNALEWADMAGITSGMYEIRALATDRAGNANILHDSDNPWQTWTVDLDDPIVVDFHHDLTDDSVAAGDPVTFTFVLTDSTTDVETARLEYWDGSAWYVIDPNPATPEIETIALVAAGIDTPNATWTGTATWTTPAPLVEDWEYEVRVVAYDTAHNEGTGPTIRITVEDDTAPEFTKIWAIPGEVKFLDYPDDNDDVYEVDCEPHDEHTHDGLFIDLDGNGRFDPNIDRAIDYGGLNASYVLTAGDTTSGTIGATTNTWPRWIDEVVLEGQLEQEIQVSHTVTVVARTQVDDTGLERVEFYAVPQTGDPILIGTDECEPAYSQANYLWHTFWNTLDVDATGDPLYPDGVYTLVAQAYDLEGNVEVWDLNDGAIVTVDNTPPEATADAQMDPGIQTAITIERNSIYTLLAETDLLEGQQDDLVTFYVKRAADLNMDASWLLVPQGEGLDASDVNPDPTRPYSFDWDLDKMDVPFPLEDPVVGVEYHMAASAADILLNAEPVTEAFEAGRYITFTVVDTHAPVATITEVKRATGDLGIIYNPHLDGVIHARDFAYLQAEMLEGDNDVERVEFRWSQNGDQMLIDAQVVRDPANPLIWRISDWDLRALQGETIEVFAVATDDVGNTVAGPSFTVYVDFEAPAVTDIRPASDAVECRDDSEFGNIYYDLEFRSADADIDLARILWEYKLTSNPDVETGWTRANSQQVVFDASTGMYADFWNVGSLASGLYDLRLTVYDVAGNMYQQIVSERVAVDLTDPSGEITRVVVNGIDNFPTHVIDISAGDVVTLWATAEDIEESEPALNTGVAEILFQAKYGSDNDWRDLGVWQAPDETVYEEVVASVDWNTSGLAEGDYDARILVRDDECNEYTSGSVEFMIRDASAPRARIAGFDPCMQPHGDNAPVYVDVYATAYSDDSIAEVQFQYSSDSGETWIPFGISDEVDDHGEMCGIWSSRLDLRSFAVGTQLVMRAIAKDSDDNQDPNPPTVAVQVVELPDGSLDLTPLQNLNEIAGMGISMVGGECPDEMVITVRMTAADQRPQVLHVFPDTWGPDPIGYCSSGECVRMEAMIDNPQPDGTWWWRGVVDVPEDDCGRMTFFANALSDDCEMIDLRSTYIWSAEVTEDLGTNGWHIVPGYLSMDAEATYLHASGRIPSGSDADGCLFIAPSTDAPSVGADQARFITQLERTSYFVNFIDDRHEEFDDGYLMTVAIEYDEAALLEAAGGDADRAAMMEPYLTARVFDLENGEGEWEGRDITQVEVDPVTNRVEFQTTALECDDAFYALFIPGMDAPVSIASFAPSSPFLGRWNYTDRDPVIVANLNATGIEDIDETSIEVWIDGQLVASWMPDGDDPDGDPDYWVQGNGTLTVERKNWDGTMYQVTYAHATQSAWWLRHGEHTLDVTFKTSGGADEWVRLPESGFGATFYVDADAPYLGFYRGWADDEEMVNISGYLNPAQMGNMLTLALFDDDAGVLVRPTDVECDDCDECDCNQRGIKYDVWLVHDEDDQVEIDEIEERVLLHSGTADELIQYMTPTYTTPGEATEGSYTPADTLFAGIPLMGGSMPVAIGDGDVLEVVIYSQKHVEPAADWQGHCEAGLIIGDFDFDDLPDTLGSIYLDCYIDESLRRHVYDQGVLDWAGNAGSEYIEQRFIVDMTPPTVVLITPAGGFAEPGESFCFEAHVEDGGAGAGIIEQPVLIGPDGEEIPLTDVEITDGTIRACVEGGLAAGHYTLVVRARDLAGNESVISVPIVVENGVLALTESYLYPNPVNPDDFEALVHFNVSRHAEITAKVYDFAGEYVATIANHEPFPAGAGIVRWAGQAEDGTDLANGAYLIRIEAFDGSATRSATVKAVIWRE